MEPSTPNLHVRLFTVQQNRFLSGDSVMPAPSKKDRLECRLSTEDKAAIEAAASLSNTSVSQFIVDAARARARVLLEEHHRIRLTEQGWHAVMAALDNPPAPNEKLKRAFESLDNGEFWE
ncbi:type II toxin-antitoxin system TacA family antitoxin [Cronobacter dublinensis]